MRIRSQRNGLRKLNELYVQVLYPIGIGFPVFPVTYSDIFHFFLRSLIADKLPKEEKYNLFRICNRKIPKTNSYWVYNGKVQGNQG